MSNLEWQQHYLREVRTITGKVAFRGLDPLEAAEQIAGIAHTYRNLSYDGLNDLDASALALARIIDAATGMTDRIQAEFDRNLARDFYDEGYAEGYLYGLSEGTGVDVFDLREMQQDGDL
jgi:hypothetical protein